MDTKPQWQGMFVAIPTPLRDDRFDWRAFEAHIEHLLRNGLDGLVVCGTTGEAATMSAAERREVITAAVKAVGGRVPVIAGAGSNSTAVTSANVEDATAAGATGLLVVTPYYNKPPQEGLYRHFSQIAARAEIPIAIYNVPGRTGVSIAPETIDRLANLPQIVAVKDATGDLRIGSKLVELCGDRLTILSGDDFTALALMAVGGHGAVSVVGNVDPARTSRMLHSALNGDFETARAIHHELTPLNEALFSTTNPIPVKKAVSLLGFGRPDVREPLIALGDEMTQRLVQVMRALGLLGDS